MADLKIAVAGASGRMGRALIEAVSLAPDMTLAAALEAKGNAHVRKDAGELVGAPCGVKISDDPAGAIAGCDVLIDFTRPEGTLDYLAQCVRQRVRMVIDTTGFNDAQRAKIVEASRGLAIAMAPNFSVGVNVMFRLLYVA